MTRIVGDRLPSSDRYVPTVADMLRLPYVVSAQYIETLAEAGPEEAESLLSRHVDFLDRVWYAHGDAAMVLLAVSSLSAQVEDRVSACLPLARLYLLEAETSIASASHPDQVLHALARAEQAQNVLATLDLSTSSFELLSESMLVAGVALKAVGRSDDSIDYLRSKVRDWRLNSLQSVALTRQEVMMFQDENRHLLLLHDASAYRELRPREYFRTVKRTTELLLNRRRLALADALTSELGNAFVAVRSELSVLARVSFMRDLAQLYAARGEQYRAQRLLLLCLRVAQRSHYPGQVRQIRGLLAELDGGATVPRLETFRVVDIPDS